MYKKKDKEKKNENYILNIKFSLGINNKKTFKDTRLAGGDLQNKWVSKGVTKIEDDFIKYSQYILNLQFLY